MSSTLALEEKLDPRVVRTRNLLGKAFIEALAEKGFQAVSVQDITERAGVNRTTFYLHFPDKYAMVDFITSQSFRQEIEKRMLNACHYSLENLQALIVTVCEFVTQAISNCAHSEPQFEGLVETQVKKQVQGLLQHWIEQEGARPATSADPSIAATAASWAIYGLALQWSRDKKHPPVEQYAQQVLPLIAASLGMGELVAASR
jgi:AcrR family transcriptional regulator